MQSENSHLAEWLQAFPSNQIFITLYDNLRRDPQSFINRLAGFRKGSALAEPYELGFHAAFSR